MKPINIINKLNEQDGKYEQLIKLFTDLEEKIAQADQMHFDSMEQQINFYADEYDKLIFYISGKVTEEEYDLVKKKFPAIDIDKSELKFKKD